MIPLAVAAVLFAVIGAYYYLRVVGQMYLTAAPSEEGVAAGWSLRFALAVALSDAGHFAEADTMFAAAMEQSRPGVYDLQSWGNHYFKQGRMEEAEAAFARAGKLDPGFAYASIMRHLCRLRQNKPGTAAEAPPVRNDPWGASLLEFLAGRIDELTLFGRLEPEGGMRYTEEECELHFVLGELALGRGAARGQVEQPDPAGEGEVVVPIGAGVKRLRSAAAETAVVVEIEPVEIRAEIVAGRAQLLKFLGVVGVPLLIAGCQCFQPARPGLDLPGGALGRGVLGQPLQHFDITLARFDRGEERVRMGAGEIEEPLVEWTGVDVFPGFASGVRAGLVEQAREMHVTAEANPGAARRMLGEIWGGVVDHGKRGRDVGRKLTTGHGRVLPQGAKRRGSGLIRRCWIRRPRRTRLPPALPRRIPRPPGWTGRLR